MTQSLCKMDRIVRVSNTLHACDNGDCAFVLPGMISWGKYGLRIDLLTSYLQGQTWQLSLRAVEPTPALSPHCFPSSADILRRGVQCALLLSTLYCRCCWGADNLCISSTANSTPLQALLRIPKIGLRKQRNSICTLSSCPENIKIDLLRHRL